MKTIPILLLACALVACRDDAKELDNRTYKVVEQAAYIGWRARDKGMSLESLTNFLAAAEAVLIPVVVTNYIIAP